MNSSTIPAPPPSASRSTTTSLTSSSPPTNSPLPPRNQIEALPPSSIPPYPPTSLYTSHTSPNGDAMILDSAKRHPVFFTEKLRKLPFGAAFGDKPGNPVNEYGNDAWRAGSPVARGYVYESGSVAEREMKL